MKTYALEEKLAAVAEYRSSGRLRATGRKLGIPSENTRRWSALLDGGMLYDSTAANARGQEEGLLAVPPKAAGYSSSPCLFSWPQPVSARPVPRAR